MFHFPAKTQEIDPLQPFYIYFDTQTFSEVEKDENTTLEAMISLIGEQWAFSLVSASSVQSCIHFIV